MGVKKIIKQDLSIAIIDYQNLTIKFFSERVKLDSIYQERNKN